MKKRSFFFLGALILLALYIANFKEKGPTFANNFQDRKLSCVDTKKKHFSEMIITSPDKGKSLDVTAGGENTKLSYIDTFMMEDHYTNAAGQVLDIDPEIKFSGFFGNSSGFCD